VSTIFEEKASGIKRDGRTELQKVLGVLGEGDTLVVTRLDRLGRSLRDLANVAHEIEEAGASLKTLDLMQVRKKIIRAGSRLCRWSQKFFMRSSLSRTL
jgi:DNA invertase Pin-like site-specific DNA recombinase